MHSSRTVRSLKVFISFLLGIIITAIAALIPVMDSGIAGKAPNTAAGKILAQAYGSADNTQDYSQDNTPDNTKDNNQEDDKYDVYKQAQGMDKSYAGPLPWAAKQVFLEAIKKYNTPIVMAAYKATLTDPLPGEAYNIGLAAQQLAGTLVQPGETFSQNKVLGPYTEGKGYKIGPTYAGTKFVTTVGGGVCKIASVLYNVATLCDLQITSRSCHSMTVPYVPPGQDATVFYGVKDFRFVNNSGGPILIWSQKVYDTLYMAFYGQKVPPQVTWHHEVKKKLKYWTIYRYNPNLPPKTEKIVMPGQYGYIVKSWVTVQKTDGTVQIKEKGMSWYSASPRVIERGPRA